MHQDNKEIWHYYMGGYKTLEQADSVRRKVFDSGYPYVYIIDVEKVPAASVMEALKAVEHVIAVRVI